MGGAIKSVADNLKSHPLAFALVIINVLFLGAVVMMLRDVADNARERTAAMNTLLAQCVEKIREPRNVR